MVRNKDNRLLWTIQIILFIAFIIFSAGKFLTSPTNASDIFGQIGGSPAQYLTGVVELIAALLIIIPSTAIFGAIFIAIIMIAAIILHLTVIGITGTSMHLFLIVIIFLALSLYIIKKRKHELVIGKSTKKKTHGKRKRK